MSYLNDKKYFKASNCADKVLRVDPSNENALRVKLIALNNGTA